MNMRKTSQGVNSVKFADPSDINTTIRQKTDIVARRLPSGDVSTVRTEIISLARVPITQPEGCCNPAAYDNKSIRAYFSFVKEDRAANLAMIDLFLLHVYSLRADIVDGFVSFDAVLPTEGGVQPLP